MRVERHFRTRIKKLRAALMRLYVLTSEPLISDALIKDETLDLCYKARMEKKSKDCGCQLCAIRRREKKR